MMADDFDEVDLALTGAADDAARKHARGKLIEAATRRVA